MMHLSVPCTDDDAILFEIRGKNIQCRNQDTGRRWQLFDKIRVYEGLMSIVDMVQPTYRLVRWTMLHQLQPLDRTASVRMSHLVAFSIIPSDMHVHASQKPGKIHSKNGTRSLHFAHARWRHRWTRCERLRHIPGSIGSTISNLHGVQSLGFSTGTVNGRCHSDLRHRVARWRCGYMCRIKILFEHRGACRTYSLKVPCNFGFYFTTRVAEHH